MKLKHLTIFLLFKINTLVGLNISDLVSEGFGSRFYSEEILVRTVSNYIFFTKDIQYIRGKELNIKRQGSDIILSFKTIAENEATIHTDIKIPESTLQDALEKAPYDNGLNKFVVSVEWSNKLRESHNSMTAELASLLIEGPCYESFHLALRFSADKELIDIQIQQIYGNDSSKVLFTAYDLELREQTYIQRENAK